MRELNSLKQQMAALQQMMRLQMDMQADVQRSIRQEISAAMNSTLGTESSGDCNNGKKNCERTLWNNQHMTIIRSICKPKINEIFFFYFSDSLLDAGVSIGWSLCHLPR